MTEGPARLPRGLESLVRALVPEEFAGDLVDDLADGFERRRRAGAGPRRWLVGELIRTPWIGLHAQARRMRAAGTRRDMPGRGGGTMGGIGTGIRIAARSLLRRPSYTAVSLTTLAVSIGAATLIFSVLEGVLLRPLPYPEGTRIYRVFGMNEAWREAEQEVLRQSWDHLDVSEDVLVALREDTPGVESAGAVHLRTARLDDGGEPVELEGGWVTEGFFRTLGMAPALGRFPSSDELSSGEPVTVVSERLWTSRYGRDPDILGRVVSLDGVAHTVVGVLPGAFGLPAESTRWWAPFPGDFADGRTDFAVLRAFVRLNPESRPAVVQASVESTLDRLAERDAAYATLSARLEPLADVVVRQVAEGIRLLFMAVGVVVLIASVNLANLIVARGARRRGELAMRTALGADRKALVWDMLAETLVLCLVGGGIGVLLATAGMDPFLRLLERGTSGFPRTDNVGLNPSVLAFSLGVAVFTALSAGLLPALAASRRAPWEALQEGRRSRGGRATRRTQSMLLLVEATLAIVLLTGGGLLLRSAANVASVDPGYDGRAVAYVSVEVPEDRVPTAADAERLGADLEARLAGLPMTTGVGRTSSLPGLGGASGDLVWRPDQAMEQGQIVWSADVSSGYFDVMDIPLRAGRTFRPDEMREDAGVVVVSELFARRWFPEGDALSATIVLGTGTRMSGGRVVSDGSEEVTIVGIVGDVRQLTVIMEPDAMFYQPTGGGTPETIHLVARGSGEPSHILEAARAVVHEYDPALLIEELDVLHQATRRLLAPLEVRLILILGLAALAALLTLAGIYGVVAYVVSDRLHEIGVRMALGARAGGESARMVRHALAPVTLGALLGSGLAVAVSGVLDSALFGVERLDPLTYGAVFLGMLGVAALAAWLPARRAAAVDPVRVLSEE